MTDSSKINPDLLEKLKNLDAYFFNVLQRAEKKAQGKLELTNNDVKQVLVEDMNLYLYSSNAASNRITNMQDDLDAREKAEKQIALTKQLDPILAAIAGIGGNRAEFENQPQVGLRGAAPVAGQQNSNTLTHPKLEPFLDQAASSFLDAYRKIYDEHNNQGPNKDQSKESTNDLDNALRNVMKYMPAFNQVKPKEELRPDAPKPQPQYVPTMKPTNRPF